MSWHIDARTLQRYASGAVTSAVAASAEAHLTGCASCRRQLTPVVDTARLDAIWAEVDERVELASRPRAERVLGRLGVGDDTARLLAVTPSLRGAWLASVVVAVGFAVLAADASPRGLVVFLTLAPLLPVAGVALAYGPATDPAYELTVAAPYSVFRLVLLRSVAVVTTTVVLTALGGLLVADAGWSAAGWLLPALALSAATLAVATRTTPVWAAAMVGTTWVVAVLAGVRRSGDDLAVFGPTGQLAALLVLAAAVMVLLRSRARLSYDIRRSA